MRIGFVESNAGIKEEFQARTRIPAINGLRTKFWHNVWHGNLKPSDFFPAMQSIFP